MKKLLCLFLIAMTCSFGIAQSKIHIMDAQSGELVENAHVLLKGGRGSA